MDGCSFLTSYYFCTGSGVWNAGEYTSLAQAGLGLSWFLGVQARQLISVPQFPLCDMGK